MTKENEPSTPAAIPRSAAIKAAGDTAEAVESAIDEAEDFVKAAAGVVVDEVVEGVFDTVRKPGRIVRKLLVKHQDKVVK